MTERESRRTVTVLFADLVGSTGIGESLDPEALRVLQSRYFESARSVIERHGGTVEKFIGDAVMAVFGWPATHEDDALRAVRAAVEVRRVVGELRVGRNSEARLHLRVGVHTGPVVATAGDTTEGALVTGDTVNTAARLQSSAEPDEILIGPLTRELVRDAVATEPLRLALRGRSEELDAHRLLEVTGDESHVRRLDTPMVGREQDLATLLAAFDAAVEDRSCRLVTVVAPAGVGKSRLLAELATQLSGRATVLTGRCLPYGDGVTYWAVAGILRDATQTAEDADPREIAAALRGRVADLPEGARTGDVLTAVVGASAAEVSADDIAWATRRFLETVARDGPLAIRVEDLHWAEPALLDLIESLVEWTHGAAILVVATARLELREQRPQWGHGGPNNRLLELPAMAPEAVEQLLDRLPGGSALPTPVRARIAAAAEGNPLFVEEMVGKLIDDGALRLEADGWRSMESIGEVSVPSSISALLAARLDGLPALERLVAERGAVVGRTFERSAVEALSPLGDRGGLVTSLLGLSRREIIQREVADLGADDAFRFRHILIRDAAYGRLSKRERADLHERFADWLEAVAVDRLVELAEILAHHLAQAVEYRLELGEDVTGSALLDRARAALLAAADRSEQLHAYSEAARLLARLIALEDASSADGGPRPTDLPLREAEARFLSGDTGAALLAAERLLEAAEDAGDQVSQAVVLERVARYRRGEGDDEGALAAMQRAAALLGEGSAVALQARILAGLARFLMLRSLHKEAASVAREAITAARSGKALREEAGATITLGTSVARLGAPEEGIALLRDGLAIARRAGDDWELLRAYANSGIVASMIGDLALCRSLSLESVEVAAQLGLSRNEANAICIVNGALNEEAFGTRERMAWFVERALAQGWTGWSGIRVQEVVARLRRMEGDWVGLEEALSVGRSLVLSSVGGSLRQEFELILPLIEAQSWLDRDQPERATILVEAVRPLANPSEIEQLVELETMALACASELAVNARRLDDVDVAAKAVAEAELHAAACHDLEASATQGVSSPLSGFERGRLLLVDCELSRARGQADPTCWRMAFEKAERVGHRGSAAYAGMRLAEALLASDAAATLVTDALDAADVAAAEHGDAAVIRRLAVLRSRAG